MADHFDEPFGEARKSAESASKPRLDLLPPAAMEAIAEVLTFGAGKYGANNWCRGARWGRYYAALLRHLFAWWRGEERDSETGLSHLAHAGCCLVFLMEYQRHQLGADDRFRGPDGKAFRKDDCITDAQPELMPDRLIERCPGEGFWEGDEFNWREGCDDCLRRTATEGPVAVRPPRIITFECPHRLTP